MMRIVHAVIWILKLLVKIILLPIIICLTIMHCILSVVTSITSVVFGLIGFGIIMIGVLSAGFGLESASEVCRMIAIGAGFCLFPILAEWLSADIALLNIRLRVWLMF